MTVRRLARTALTAAVCLGLFGLAGCPQPYKDVDDTHESAMRIVSDLEIEDELNHGRGDKVDWKSITPMEDGKVTVKLRVGDPFKGSHGLTGNATIYDTSARQITAAGIRPNTIDYTLVFEAKGGVTYLVKLDATKGQSTYKVSYALASKPKDPCANVECDDDEICKEGECFEIAKPEPEVKECKPACRRGWECVEGKCEKPCGGGCKRGEYCNTRSNECVQDPCYGKKCDKNESCIRGQCIAKPEPVKKGCDPACGAGQKCVDDKCVDDKPSTTGPISASVVQVVPQGASTALVLNRGKAHNVKQGDSGTIPGVGAFTIQEVYEFRCKAVVKAQAQALASTKKVTINRK